MPDEMFPSPKSSLEVRLGGRAWSLGVCPTCLETSLNLDDPLELSLRSNLVRPPSFKHKQGSLGLVEPREASYVVPVLTLIGRCSDQMYFSDKNILFTKFHFNLHVATNIAGL